MDTSGSLRFRGNMWPKEVLGSIPEESPRAPSSNGDTQLQQNDAAISLQHPSRASSLQIDAAIVHVQQRLEALLEESEVASVGSSGLHSVDFEPLVPLKEINLIGPPEIKRLPRTPVKKGEDVKERARAFLNELLAPQLIPPDPKFPPEPAHIREPCPIAHDSLKARVFESIN